MEFVIPQHPEDLEAPSTRAVFVQNVLDVENCADVDSVIEGVATAVLDSDDVFQTVVSHAVFDNVYSLIKFWSCHGASVKQRVVELLVSMAQEVMGALHVVNASGVSPAQAAREMAQRRTAFKAVTYLYAIGVQVADKTSVPQGAEALAGAAGKRGGKAAGKGSKSKKAAAAADDDEFGDEEPGADGDGATDGAWDWPTMREPCLRLLTDLLCVDMRKLWPLGVPEEEMIGVVVKTGARVLGNGLAMKDKACKRAVVELLALACRRFPSIGTATVVAVVDAVTKAEHAVGVAVDLVELMSAGLTPQGTVPDAASSAGGAGDDEEGGAGAGAGAGAAALVEGLPHGGRFFAPAAAAELLREVGRVNTGSSSSSEASAGLKRASSFIQEVSERCPPLVLANLACLLPHLDSDNATLRSALVATLGNIVARSYNSATAEAAAKAAAASASATGGDPAAAAAESSAFSTRTRDALLDALAERIHDVHSFTRAAALRAWVALAGTAAVPVDRFTPVTLLAVGRLMDKAALVRKMAAQLLRTLLENNPFGPRVDPALFKAQLATVDAWLVANAPAPVLAQLGLAPPAAASDGQGAGAGAGAGSKKGGAKGGKGRKGVVDEDEDGEGEGEQDAADALTEELLAESAAEMEGGGSGSGSGAGQEVEVTITPQVQQYLRYKSSLTAAASFAEALLPSLPCAVELLSSKTASDVREAIKLLSRARAFSVPGAEGSLARMLVLVWSDEPGVRDEVVETFDALYLRNEALADDEEDASEAAGAAAAGAGVGAGAAAAEAAPAPAPAAAEPAAGAARPKRSTRAKASVSLAEDDEEDDFEDEEDEEEGAGAGKGKKKAPAKGKGVAKGKGATAAKAEPAASTAATAAAKPKKRKAPRSASTLDPVVVATNLVGLLAGAPQAVRTSLEEVLREAATQQMLPPGLGDALWDMVGEGLTAISRGRQEVAACLLHVRNGNADTAIPATRALVQTADSYLSRARAAMAILSMVGAALPGTLDSPEALSRMAWLMRSDDGQGIPVGAAFLRAATRELMAITPAGQAPDLKLVEMALSVGDYRLARHTCVALQRIKGYSVAQPPRRLMAGAASAPADGADAASTKGKGGKAGGAKAGAKAAAAEAEAAAAEAQRASSVHQLLNSVAAMIKGAWDGGEVECAHYYPAAQAGIDAIFTLCPQPLSICTPMLTDMAAGLVLDMSAGAGSGAGAGGNSSGVAYLPTFSSARMSRLFFVLGHVALRTLAHTEALASRVKLLRIRAAEKAERDHASGEAAAAAAPAGKGGKGSAGAGGAKANSAAKDGIEEQLGVSAAEDEKEAELTVHIAEHELASSNLCGLFSPLLKKVVMGHLVAAQEAESASTVLHADALTQSALLALCKLMAVSASFCEAHLQLIFTVLARSPCPSLRGTIAVALGDLAVRYPNLTEPYTSHMYARLRDSDTGVRRSALMVLTHLILAEQIKVKGNVGEIAVCLNDEDQRIADLTRMFFTELSKRSGSPIYNLLPDTLSCLSRLANPQAHAASAAAAAAARGGAGAGSASSSSSAAAAAAMASTSSLRPLDQETFRDIVKFLLGFVNKDKQSEALAEKLLHRLEAAESTTGPGGAGAAPAGGIADEATKALWRDVSYCLSQLPLSDKIIRKLAEGVRGYAPALADDDVWESFVGMLAKARKMVVAGGGAPGGAGGAGAGTGAGSGAPLSKAELREVVEAWDRSLHEARSGSMEEDAAMAAAKAASRRAKRVAAVEGIDQHAITAAALAKAKEAAAAATAEAAEAAKAGKGAKGKGAAKAPASKAAAAAAEEDEEDMPPPAPTSRSGRGAGASAAAPAPAAASSRRRKGIIEDSDDEEEGNGGDENEGGAGAGAGKAAVAGRSTGRATGSRAGASSSSAAAPKGSAAQPPAAPKASSSRSGR